MTSDRQVAIVTGGASGLGAEICSALLKEGFAVAIWDIALVKQYEDSVDSNIYCCECDITKTEQIKIALDNTIQALGNVSILINNAGVIHNEPLVNLFSAQRQHSISSWNKVMALNLTATFEVTSFVAEHMLQKRIKGLIINISSVSAKGNAGQSAYSATKAGVEAMSKVWAKELGPMGIRSLSIAPGFIETPSTKCALPKEKLEEIKSKTALNRLGLLTHISSTVIYAIKNDYLTNTTIEVDGGVSI